VGADDKPQGTLRRRRHPTGQLLDLVVNPMNTPRRQALLMGLLAAAATLGLAG